MTQSPRPSFHPPLFWAQVDNLHAMCTKLMTSKDMFYLPVPGLPAPHNTEPGQTEIHGRVQRRSGAPRSHGRPSPDAFRLCLEHVCSVGPDSLRPHGPQPVRLRCPWDAPGKNTGVGCHFLLQEIFPTQGWNPCLPALVSRFFTTSAT